MRAEREAEISKLRAKLDADKRSMLADKEKETAQLVAKARRKSPADIDRIAQGRVWDGGSARQLGLVDGFGGMSIEGSTLSVDPQLPDGMTCLAFRFHWHGMRVLVEVTGEEVRVEASARVDGPGGLFDFLPGVTVRSTAVAVAEETR